MVFDDLESLTENNTNFRKVIHTGKHSQLVLMSIPVGDDIGMETHETTDQILFLVEGEAQAILNGKISNVKEDDVVFVPAGTQHNIINSGSEDLKLYTVYSPPEHPDGTVRATKQETTK